MIRFLEAFAMRFFKNKNELVQFLKNTALVVLGTFVLAFGTSVFIIPFDLVTGGVSGIGIILHASLRDAPFFGDISTETYASVINWLFFFVGFMFLGKHFALKTLVSTAVYPVALYLMSLLTRSDFFNLGSPMYADYRDIAIILAAVLGGAAIGAGVSLTFFGGGSTGGVDIVTLVICKYFKRLKSSVVMFLIDAVVVIAGMFALNNLVLSLVGVISAFICAIVIDRIFIGASRAFTAEIVSDKYEEINRGVIQRMNRTTTVSDAYGGYSGAPKKVVSVTFSMNQYATFIALISSVDKNAFVTVHRAHEINGEGWTYESEE